MRVVSENSEAKIARHRAMSKASRALRELAANLLRVIRGAGKQYEIVTQVLTLSAALIEYHEAGGNFDELDELANLSIGGVDFEVTRQMDHENLEIYLAEQSIISGALQIAASRLIGQRAQESAGHHEMYDGANRLKAAQEEIRKRLLVGAKPTRRRKNPWDRMFDEDAFLASGKPTGRRATKHRVVKKRRAAEAPKI